MHLRLGDLYCTGKSLRRTNKRMSDSASTKSKQKPLGISGRWIEVFCSLQLVALMEILLSLLVVWF